MTNGEQAARITWVRRHRRLTRAAALAVSLLLSLLLGETLVRLFDIGPQINPIFKQNFRLSENDTLGFELVPHSRDGFHEINSDGMRNREYATRKPPGVFRIACLGDSICYGYGSDRNESYPAQLEKLLNQYFGEKGIIFEVLNFGVTGYNITQSVENLRSRALRYRPDLVLFQYCLNDPQEYSFELEGLKAMLTPARKNYRDRRTGPAAGEWLNSSRLYILSLYSFQSIAHRGKSTGWIPPDRQWDSLQNEAYIEYFSTLHADGAPWRRVEEGLDAIAALADENGFSSLVVLFPIFKDLGNYPLAGLHDQVLRAARERSLGALDLLEIYRDLAREGKKDFIFNDLHPSSRGHEIAARAIIEELLKREMLPGLMKEDSSAWIGGESPDQARPE